MPSLNKKVTITLGTSIYKPEDIIQKTLSTTQLFKRLSVPNLQEKKEGKYFVFASFNKKSRNAANIDKYFGATIDLDDTPLTVKEIRRKFKRYNYCIYSTFQHKLPSKGDRYRLVLPYKAPVDPVTHVETMLYLMSLLGKDNVDLSSKALSRAMYLPAISSKRKKKFEYYKHVDGLFFNPMSANTRDKIAALRFEQGETESAVSEEPMDMNKKVDEGERNDSLARAIGKFIKTGVANDEIMPLAQAWNDTHLYPPLSTKDVKTVVESIIKSHARNHNDLSWGYDEIINRIKKAKEITQDYDHILDMIVMAKTKNKFKPSQVSLLVLELSKKSKVGQRIIKEEITSKELELAGRLESAADGSFESTTNALRDDFKNWVYVATDDRVYNFRTGEYYKREAFSAMFANPNVEGSLFTLIMKFNLMKKVSRLEFDPAKEEVYMNGGVKYANTYIHPEIFPIPGDISMVLDHFKYLIPNKRECSIILDFIAHMVQHPGIKIRWMPVIKGGKGIGKTIIAEKVIMPLIGFTNFGKVNNELIKSDFNAWQLDKQVIIFEELNIGANQKEKEQLTDKLKSFITDNLMMAHRKGLDPYDTINKCNSLGFTNAEDAIIITPDERRFCMIRSEARPRKPMYYQTLADFTDKNLAEIYHFFIERDLSGFSPLVAPDTAYTREIKNLSMSWPGSIIQGWCSDNKNQFSKYGCITYTNIVNGIRAESSGRYRSIADDLQSPGSAQSRKLHHSLRNLGFVKWVNPEAKDGRMRVNGRLEHIWVMPGWVDSLQDASKKVIMKRIKKIKVIDENWAD